MLIPNHPDDKRLAALAASEPDAAADASLSAHVASCSRCSEIVADLSVLGTALADLPDVQPSRPLRLLPAADEAPTPAPDRIGGWARRFFAPVLASGVALALVGAIGTASPSLSGMAGGPDSQAVVSQPAVGMPAVSGDAAGFEAAPVNEAQTLSSAGDRTTADSAAGAAAAASQPADNSTLEAQGADAEAQVGGRSPWPMVLFAGVALIAAAVLMRWIFAPSTS